jgi:hypothetical protein
VITQAVCKHLLGELDGNLNKIRGAMKTLKRDFGSLKLSLGDYIPTEDISAVLDMVSNVPIPDFGEGGGELMDMITSCTYLEGSPFLSNPGSAAASMIGAFVDAAYDVLGEISSIDLDMSLNLNRLTDKLGAFDLTSAIPGADKIINCLSSICGTDVSDQIDEMNALMNDMNLGDDGNLDSAGLFDSIGLSTNAKDNLNGAGSAIGGLKDRVTGSVTSFSDNFGF